MPSGKRQLRSASSDARSTQSPLASGTYIKKETPGGLQSELKTVIFMLSDGTDCNIFLLKMKNEK